MKFHKSLILISLFLISFINYKNDVEGLYISKEPSVLETISIMYSRGYFHYLYSSEGSIQIKISHDNTFNHTFENGKIYNGNWELKENYLILDYSDTLKKDLKLTIWNNKIYCIRETTLCNSKKVKKHLLLLEKK